MKNHTSIAVIAFFLFAIPNFGAYGKNTIDWKKIGSWQIRVDRTLDDSCFMFATYSGGTTFRVGILSLKNREPAIYGMIGNRKWKSVEPGKDYYLGFKFGKEETWEGEATAYKIGGQNALFLRWTGDDMAKFADEFMRKTSVRIFYNGKQIQHLSLRGSSIAFKEMLRCQAAVIKIKNRLRLKSDPFSVESDPYNDDPFK